MAMAPHSGYPSRAVIISLVSVLFNLRDVTAFLPYQKNTQRIVATHGRSDGARYRTTRTKMSTSDDTANAESTATSSTLTLLEHVNLNIPDHKFGLPFYQDLLGLGLDPRRAENVVEGSGTVWANCGASQFHLPVGEVGQRIPGSIGLVYEDLEAVKERLEDESLRGCYEKAEVGVDERSGKEYVRIVDRYGNVFYLREKKGTPSNEPVRSWKQPILSETDPDHVARFPELVRRYGRETTECAGIDYVEFRCRRNTAFKIAEFYDCVLDAPVTTLEDSGDDVAIIGFGAIDPSTGRASQSLLFRESDEETPPYDGHHLSMYVGDNNRDYEAAFRNCEMAGIVWVNPRFSDKVVDMDGARERKQFRFKDIVDMESGEKLFELEHEIRSIEHSAWSDISKGGH